MRFGWCTGWCFVELLHCVVGLVMLKKCDKCGVYYSASMDTCPHCEQDDG